MDLRRFQYRFKDADGISISMPTLTGSGSAMPSVCGAAMVCSWATFRLEDDVSPPRRPARLSAGRGALRDSLAELVETADEQRQSSCRLTESRQGKVFELEGDGN